MKANNISNNFLSNNSELFSNNHSFNENENYINKKYFKLEQKQSDINASNKEEKYKIYDTIHKKAIFEKNYGEKISLYSQANQSTTSKTKSKRNLPENKKDSLSLDEYIEELKHKYEEDPIYFESMDESINKKYYLYSFCFFCHHLAFAYEDQVTCVNKCFLMKIKTEEFSQKYTLDNLLESHFDFSEGHLECNGDIILIYIDEKKKEPFFICNVCDKEILEKNEIIL